MNYGTTARVYAWVFSKLLKDYYRETLSASNRKALCQAIRKEYKAMVRRTPGIGGSSNESNLVGACYFFAAAKVIPHMTPALLDDMIQTSISSPLMVRVYGRQKKKGTLFSQSQQQKRMAEAQRSHQSTYEMDWEFTYRPGKEDFYITYTRCGICKLAEREHMEPFLPCLCRMDFPKYKLAGARLVRTKTLAAGDACCNFHVIKE